MLRTASTQADQLTHQGRLTVTDAQEPASRTVAASVAAQRINQRAPVAKITALALVTALAGCVTAPTGPTVLVLPGSQKTFEQFRADDTQCRSYALNLNQGKTAQQAATESGIGSAVVGTVVGALAGAALGGRHGAGAGASVGLVVGGSSGAQAAHAGAQGTQRQYDNAYVQCMYAQGHRVPMPAGSQAAQPAAPASPATPATAASTAPGSSLTAPPPPGSPVPPGYRPPPPNQPPPALPQR